MPGHGKGRSEKIRHNEQEGLVGTRTKGWGVPGQGCAGSEKTQDTIVRMVIRRSPLIQTKWSDRGTDNGNARTRISGE